MTLTVLALLAVGAGTGSAGPASPSLRVLDRQPLVVGGAGFRASERVRLTGTHGRRAIAARATAGRGGRFTIRLRDLALTRCGPSLMLLAVGSSGSRAGLKTPAAVCPPD